MLFSKDWFCMKLHCFINICLRLLTAGWYVVTKGKILSSAFFFCVRADGLEAKLKRPFCYCFWVAAICQALFEFHKSLLECCFWRVIPGHSHCFTFNLMKPLLTSSGWHIRFLNISPLSTTLSRKKYLSIKSFRLSAFPWYTVRR